MPEHFKVVCILCQALLECSVLPFLSNIHIHNIIIVLVYVITDTVDWSLWPIGSHHHHHAYSSLELPSQLDDISLPDDE